MKILVPVLLLLLAGCSNGPPGDNDRWLLPLLFSLLFSAMFKFLEIVWKWWRNRKPLI